MTLKISATGVRTGIMAATVTYTVMGMAGRTAVEATAWTGSALTEAVAAGTTMLAGDMTGAAMRALSATATDTACQAVRQTSRVGSLVTSAVVGAAAALSVTAVEMAVEGVPVLVERLRTAMTPATGDDTWYMLPSGAPVVLSIEDAQPSRNATPQHNAERQHNATESPSHEHPSTPPPRRRLVQQELAL